MVYFDQLLRAVVPDGFVLELLLSVAIQTRWLTPVAILMALLLWRSTTSAATLIRRCVSCVARTASGARIVIRGKSRNVVLTTLKRNIRIF
jgi:hypothetical protein